MKSRLAFGQDVLAQALGTLIGGGVLFLIGKLSGVLGSVDWGEVGKAAILFAIVILLASIDIAVNERRRQKNKEERDERVKKRLEAMTPEEVVAINAYMDKGRWNNFDPDKQKELEGLIVRMVTRDV
jgi:di/tricarboxylate transporter